MVLRYDYKILIINIFSFLWTHSRFDALLEGDIEQLYDERYAERSDVLPQAWQGHALTGFRVLLHRNSITV